MGFNTVAFVLNDFTDDLQKSPKTTADILAYAPHDPARDDVRRYAESNGEEVPHFQAIEAHSFHADDTHWYRAGQNSLAALKFVSYTTRYGRPCVVLEIPGWAVPRKRGPLT